MIETIIRPQDSCPEVSFCVSLFVIVSHAFDDFSGLFGNVVHLLLIVPHRGEPVHRREDADADGEGQKDEHLFSEAFLLRAFFGRCLRVRFVRLRFGDDFGGRGGRGGQRRGGYGDNIADGGAVR